MSMSRDNGATASGFSGAATTYDRWAMAQRAMADRLVAHLPERLAVDVILDVGCGTGLLTEWLRRRYPKATILGIDVAEGMIALCRRRWPDDTSVRFQVADAETFTADQSVGLIASNSCFQWFGQRERTLCKLASQLAPGGYLAATVLVDGSLAELAASYQAVLGHAMPGLNYAEPSVYVETLTSAGLSVAQAQTETLRTHFATGLDALRSFKGTGASFQHQMTYAPLTVRQLRRVADHYEQQYDGDDGVPVTFQVLCLVAEAPR